MALCTKQETYLNNLKTINTQAGVEPDLVDIIVAYARLRLERNLAITFYQEGIEKKTTKYPSLRTIIDKNQEADPRALNFLAAYYLEMDRRNLLCIFNRQHLAVTLGVSISNLEKQASTASSKYSHFFAPKKSGGQREILAPHPELKALQRKILDSLLDKVPLNAHAEGFRRKRSIVTNAQRHPDKKIVIKIDIKDFFPSTTANRVFGMFAALGYPKNIAAILTDLTTYQGRLATGAPTSPAISNILCRRLDKRFARLGQANDFSYSRYADDLTISSNHPKVTTMIPFFRQIVSEEGYTVNEKKLRIMRSGSRQQVTGIVVNQKLNIPRHEIRKLRAVIHNCKQKSLKVEIHKWAKLEKNHPNPTLYTEDDFEKSLSAKIHFVKMVNPSAGTKLLVDFKSLGLRTVVA
ncbi:MAG: reverse transcriptase family protein [Proteobacteria bacterium]|nr:RNA-directed DNA polymerase [Desulfobulbaceae bacterium]MBU4153715.1 reverse transcriptase family protein [Pseudomonadota bacterium]